MKNLLLAVVVLAMVFGVGSANGQGKISLGIGADVLMPIGSFGDVYNVGFGGTARGQYMVNDMFSVMLTAGYISIGAKDQGQSIVKLDNASMIPILAGAKYFFTPSSESFRPYGALEIGITSFKQTLPSVTILGVTYGGGSASSTEFTYAPAIGFESALGSGNTKLDVAVRWNGISDANAIGGRVGVLFGLGN